jgi:polyhydroxybutyrate depolymerase
MLLRLSIVFILIFSCAQAYTADAKYDFLFSIPAGKSIRNYRLHIPVSYNMQKSYPLIIMFHGGGGNSQAVMEETRWCEKADREGFIMAFPDAYRPFPNKRASFMLNPQTWNDGSGRFYTGKNNIDDITFVRSIIADISQRYNINPRRIYASGFSNGASMAFRVGIELADTIAAIAPVSGVMWHNPESLSSPVSLIYITGGADTMNPLSGGRPKLSTGKVWSSVAKMPVQEFIDNWAKLLHCTQNAKLLQNDNGIKIMQWKNEKNNSEVLFYIIDDLGHVWPGGKAILPERMVGKTSNKINATDIIWQFFQEHPKY